jgi:hypothetical protein
MGIVKAGIKIECDRRNALSKNKVQEDVPALLVPFYQDLMDKGDKAPPMLDAVLRYPDAKGKMIEKRVAYDILGPNTLKTILPLFERLDPPKPKKTKAESKAKTKTVVKVKPKAEKPKAEPKAPTPAPGPKPNENQIDVDDDLFE